MRKKKFKPSEKIEAKKPWYILKDSRGHGSVTVTLMLVSFWITTLAFIFSMIGSIGDVQFREFDAGAASAYLIPILTLYFGRKWTDSKNPSPTEELGNENFDK
jgi:hypothetical protein